MKDFKFTEDEQRQIGGVLDDLVEYNYKNSNELVIKEIESIIQARADADGCSAKDAEIAELKRRVEELEQNAPKLVLPSVEEMRKYLNGYFGFGGDPSISDREYGFEHGYDYTIDEIKRLNGI